MGLDQQLRSVHLIGSAFVLVFDRQMQFVDVQGFQTLNRVTFKEDILGLTKVDPEVFGCTGVLSLNGRDKSTHLLMKEASVVGKVEAEGRAWNVLVGKEGFRNQLHFDLLRQRPGRCGAANGHGG